MDKTWYETLEKTVQEKMKQLFAVLNKAFTDIESLQPRYFILRQLLRSYGREYLSTIIQTDEFKWLWSFPNTVSVV